MIQTSSQILTPVYTQHGQLKALKDITGIEIPLSALWINKFPAIHLKLFDATKIPFEKIFRFISSSDSYTLAKTGLFTVVVGIWVYHSITKRS